MRSSDPAAVRARGSTARARLPARVDRWRSTATRARSAVVRTARDRRDARRSERDMHDAEPRAPSRVARQDRAPSRGSSSNAASRSVGVPSRRSFGLSFAGRAIAHRTVMPARSDAIAAPGSASTSAPRRRARASTRTRGATDRRCERRPPRAIRPVACLLLHSIGHCEDARRPCRDARRDAAPPLRTRRTRWIR